jgi:uncharacterized protein YidB (DUF937 family)
MELMDLFKMGASLIEGNKDGATSGLNMDDISGALSRVISNSDGGLDLSSLVGKLSENGLGEVVGSWLGQGENREISTDQVSNLLGDDKIANFASELGLSTDSAKQALADALPQVVDRATAGEHSIVDEMLSGNSNPMEMFSKMFR